MVWNLQKFQKMVWLIGQSSKMKIKKDLMLKNLPLPLLEGVAGAVVFVERELVRLMVLVWVMLIRMPHHCGE